VTRSPISAKPRGRCAKAQKTRKPFDHFDKLRTGKLRANGERHLLVRRARGLNVEDEVAAGAPIGVTSMALSQALAA